MFGQMVRGDEILFSLFSLMFLFFCSNDMMQTLIDVLPLWQLWASLHSRPLPCCASPGCLRCWSHGES